MARIPRWFQSYLQHSKESYTLILLIAVITGVTSFGLPTPPKIIQDVFENNQWLKWVMLWLLIYQG